MDDDFLAAGKNKRKQEADAANHGSCVPKRGGLSKPKVDEERTWHPVTPKAWAPRLAWLRRLALIALGCGCSCSGDLVLQAPDGLAAPAVLGVIWSQDLSDVRSLGIKNDGVLVDRLEADDRFAPYGLQHDAEALGLDEGPLPLPGDRGRRAPISGRFLLEGNRWIQDDNLSAPRLPPFRPQACWSRGHCAVRSCDGCAEDEDFALCGPCTPQMPTPPVAPSRECPAGWTGEERADGFWFCAPPEPAPELSTPCDAGLFRTFSNPTCRPIAACSDVGWPDAPAGMNAIYVDANAPAGGDGSAALPYRELASAGARVVNTALLLKPGRYPAALRLEDSVVIGSGTCTELVSLNTRHTVAMDGDCQLSQLRLTSDVAASAWIKPQARVVADGIEIASTSTHAVVVAGDMQFTAGAIRVSGARQGDGPHVGVLVNPAARFECEACDLSGGYGVYAPGSEIEIALSDVHYVSQSHLTIATHLAFSEGSNSVVTASQVRVIGSPAAFRVEGAEARLTLSDSEFWLPKFITETFSSPAIVVRGFKPPGEFGTPAYADIRRVSINTKNRGIDVQHAVLERAEDWSIDAEHRPLRVDGLREPVAVLQRMRISSKESDHLAAVGLRNLTFKIEDAWLAYGEKGLEACMFDDGLAPGLGLSPTIVLSKTQIHLQSENCIFARSNVELYDVKFVGLQGKLLGPEFGLNGIVGHRVAFELNDGIVNFDVASGNLGDLSLSRSESQNTPAVCLGPGMININRFAVTGGTGPMVRLLADSQARLTDVDLGQTAGGRTFETAESCNTAIDQQDEPSPQARLERARGQMP